MATQDREQKLRAYAERRRARDVYDKPKKSFQPRKHTEHSAFLEQLFTPLRVMAEPA